MRVCRTYKVLPNICVKFESLLKKAAGPPGSFACTINANIIREKLVAICFLGNQYICVWWLLWTHHCGNNEDDHGYYEHMVCSSVQGMASGQ